MLVVSILIVCILLCTPGSRFHIYLEQQLRILASRENDRFFLHSANQLLSVFMNFRTKRPHMAYHSVEWQAGRWMPVRCHQLMLLSLCSKRHRCRPRSICIGISHSGPVLPAQYFRFDFQLFVLSQQASAVWASCILSQVSRSKLICSVNELKNHSKKQTLLFNKGSFSFDVQTIAVHFVR